MDFQEFKKAVMTAAQDRGLEAYELYYQTTEETSLGTFRKELNEFSSHLSGGVCFRCIVNGKMGYASTQILSEAEAVRLVEQAMEGASVLETEEEVFLGEGGQVYEAFEARTCPIPTTEEMITLALKNQDILYATDPAVADGTMTEAMSGTTTIAICNSKGLDLSYTGTFAGLIAMVVVNGEGEMADAYDLHLGDLSSADLETFSAKLVKKAKDKLGADVAPTGSYPVIFSPDAMSDLLATFSSVFSAKNAQKGLSMLKDKEGEVIASPAVTLVDDPFFGKSLMPMPFDAEGSPTHKKDVIRAGKLETLLHNLETAHKAGVATTGNASKSGYDAPVAIRPFTMYLAPGELTADELLAKAGNGVYINALGGLHAGANQISGDFSLQSAGFLIEDGKKTTPVKSFTVAGNFFRLLESIVAVGNDLKVANPSNITAFGAPTVMVEGLSIAGK